MPANVLITGPTDRPVTLAEAYSYMRVDGSTPDATNAILALDGAIAEIDPPTGWPSIALCEQTWELVLDGFPACDGEIQIPFAPLIEVVSIKYRDADLAEQTLDPDSYMVDDKRKPGWVLPGAAGWPSVGDTANAVTVRFICGWVHDGGSPSVWTGPKDLKLAVLMIAADLFENRQRQQGAVDLKLNPMVDAILTRHKARWTF